MSPQKSKRGSLDIRATIVVTCVPVVVVMVALLWFHVIRTQHSPASGVVPPPPPPAKIVSPPAEIRPAIPVPAAIHAEFGPVLNANSSTQSARRVCKSGGSWDATNQGNYTPGKLVLTADRKLVFRPGAGQSPKQSFDLKDYQFDDLASSTSSITLTSRDPKVPNLVFTLEKGSN